MFALIASLPSATPAAAGGGAQVAFSPSSSSGPNGGSATVFVTVANVSNLGGYDVFVQFDPAIVQMTDLVDSGFVTGGGNIVICSDAAIDNNAGTGTISCATLTFIGTPVPGVSTVDARSMVQASFDIAGLGVSPLTLTGTKLLDPNDAAISATLGSGSITGTFSGPVGGVTELSGGRGDALSDGTGNSGGLSTPSFTLLLMLTTGLIGAAIATAIWRRSRA